MKRNVPIVAFALMFGVFWSCLDAGAARTYSSFSSVGPVQTAQDPVSPRLAALRKDLEAGNRAALEQFWQEVTTQGTPLVEPIQGDERNLFVSFLWRRQERNRKQLCVS